MRNIELKARCADLADAAAVCRQLGARRVWTRRQTDVYFRVAEGRLKLRTDDAGEATLVAYRRADQAAARDCRYELTPVAEPAAALADLEARHGVLARVDKTRTLYLLEHVRIHLDAVAGLGTFIEFEAVMEPHYDDAETRRRLAALLEAFGIRREDVLARSYVDYVARDA